MIGSATIWPIRRSGLSALMGSWNTIATSRPRCERHRRSGAPASSAPASRIEPVTRAASGASPISAEASTDLPQPDSPTMPTRSPGAMDRLASRTAWAAPKLMESRSTSSIPV